MVLMVLRKRQLIASAACARKCRLVQPGDVDAMRPGDPRQGSAQQCTAHCSLLPAPRARQTPSICPALGVPVGTSYSGNRSPAAAKPCPATGRPQSAAGRVAVPTVLITTWPAHFPLAVQRSSTPQPPPPGFSLTYSAADFSFWTISFPGIDRSGSPLLLRDTVPLHYHRRSRPNRCRLFLSQHPLGTRPLLTSIYGRGPRAGR